MTFDELKELDKNKAFKDFYTVEEAKSSGLIPKDYHSIFKEKCKCGSDCIISRNRKTVMCVDPRCKYKETYMLKYLFDSYKCKNVGLNICYQLITLIMHNDKVNNTGYKLSHLRVLSLNRTSLTHFTINQQANIIRAINTIKTTKTPINLLIPNLGLPTIGINTEKVFEKFNYDIEDMKNSVVKRGMRGALMIKGLGFNNPMKLFYMTEFFKDIYYATKVLKGAIRKPGAFEYYVCMTGKMYPYGNRKSKSELIDMLNDMSYTKQGRKIFEFIQKNSSPKSCEYILSDDGAKHDKYYIAKEREENFGKKVLLTSTEFLDEVKSVMIEYNKKEEEIYGKQ